MSALPTELLGLAIGVVGVKYQLNQQRPDCHFLLLRIVRTVIRWNDTAQFLPQRFQPKVLVAIFN